MGKKKVDLAPYIIKQSSQDGKLSSEDSGIGLDIYSKYGTVGLSKNKNTQSYDGQGSLKTKSKNITYGKNFKVPASINCLNDCVAACDNPPIMCVKPNP